MQHDADIDDSDDIEIISKSQHKRESREITRLGKRLVELSATQLADLPIDEPIREAIALALKIQNKPAALKRHYLYLGKLLRACDTGLIFAAVDRIEKASQVEIEHHHQAERWRDRVLEQGFDAIEEFVLQRNTANRQNLRQLWRNYKSAKSDSKKIQTARLIYKNIKQAIDNVA